MNVCWCAIVDSTVRKSLISLLSVDITPPLSLQQCDLLTYQSNDVWNYACSISYRFASRLVHV